ncbi:MAG: hypothetical protein EA351_06390 [Gemmatimonadales bacterium]|nr:MAG: hypothetical protein EA351_06390 [Gemmatimonadales bacterium]
MTISDLRNVRVDLAVRSSWNIGFFAAGLTFCSFATVVAVYVPLDVAKIYWLVGTFFIFPVAVLASRILGVDPFSRGNQLGEFVGHTHLPVPAFLPLTTRNPRTPR